MIELAKLLLSYPTPGDEAQRLTALAEYLVADTPAESEFDHIVQLAADLFEVPTALISFVEKDRQFFKARVGFDLCETARDVCFCAHMLVRNDVLVIPDARKDVRFKDNPLVTSAPFIRFYAGAPLATAEGHNIGSICLIDTEPRPPLTEREEGLLLGLARLTMDHLELRRHGILKRAFLRMASAIPDAIVCADEDAIITFWNEAAEIMFGYSRGEALGKRLETILPEFRATFRGRKGGCACAQRPMNRGKAIEILGARKDKSRSRLSSP